MRTATGRSITRGDFLQRSLALGISLVKIETLTAFGIEEHRKRNRIPIKEKPTMNIKPFKIAIPEKELKDLNHRIKNMRGVYQNDSNADNSTTARLGLNIGF